MPFIVACALFYCFWEGRKRETERRQEETQVRQAARGDASPLGGREKRNPVRRPCGFAIRRQKRFDRFIADLQSAAVGFSCLLL